MADYRDPRGGLPGFRGRPESMSGPDTTKITQATGKSGPGLFSCAADNPKGHGPIGRTKGVFTLGAYQAVLHFVQDWDRRAFSACSRRSMAVVVGCAVSGDRGAAQFAEAGATGTCRSLTDTLRRSTAVRRDTAGGARRGRLISGGSVNQGICGSYLQCRPPPKRGPRFSGNPQDTRGDCRPGRNGERRSSRRGR